MQTASGLNTTEHLKALRASSKATIVLSKSTEGSDTTLSRQFCRKEGRVAWNRGGLDRHRMCIWGKECIPLLKHTVKLVQGLASSVTIDSTYCYLQETLENKEAFGGCNNARSTLHWQATRDLCRDSCHAHISSMSMQQLDVHDAAALLQPIDSVLAYRNCFTADVVEHRQDILWNGGSEYVADLIQKKLFWHAARQTCK